MEVLMPRILKKTKPAAKSKPEFAQRPEFALRMERWLFKRRQELESFQKRSESPELDLDNMQGDVIDQSMEGVAWLTQESVNQNAARELGRIELALQRIDAGNFGICESCDEKIPHARLRVRPDATLCVSCQESAERDRHPMLRSVKRVV